MIVRITCNTLGFKHGDEAEVSKKTDASKSMISKEDMEDLQKQGFLKVVSDFGKKDPKEAKLNEELAKKDETIKALESGAAEKEKAILEKEETIKALEAMVEESIGLAKDKAPNGWEEYLASKGE